MERVLIESDWNLKYVNVSAPMTGDIRINRIRLEFKDATKASETAAAAKY